LFALSGVGGGDKFEWQTLHGYNSIYDSMKNPDRNAETETEVLILVLWLLVCAGIDTRDRINKKGVSILAFSEEVQWLR